MDLSTNTAAPVLQIVTVVNCINALGNIFYQENFLNETTKQQSIPVINTLYDYFSNNTYVNRQVREQFVIDFSKKLGNNCNLKKEDESNVATIGRKVTDIIEFIVFDGNLEKFIQNIKPEENIDDVKTEDIENALTGKLYDNADGTKSTLTERSIEIIMKDIVSRFLYSYDE
ncbi:uncharacterized protein LOC122503572 [Leptopilina heterotoma]|uniref:uncharacterized protein LOC122503528 n=1 Tax=Leptopilina heterotoma TaxID=63436 RepID=UPI001CA95587|nr:uncharacterized protein LOC122503528 [Leptopilina heterotoma]XP_043470097.1 uncharacterized protein LOC122503572 [Leptopilina heterotoma]